MTHHKRVSKSDKFYTPKWMVDVLTNYIDFSNSTVWECACGEGHISDNLKAKKVINTDIELGLDFLSPWKLDNPSFDYIVTNPPFSLKNQFLKKALSYNVPVCMLLPLPCLGNEGTQKYLEGAQVIIPDKRCNFINGGDDVAFTSVWACFGCSLPKDLIFHKVLKLPIAKSK
jgi:hypothetical protein